MLLTWPPKDPNDRLDYKLDWSVWLAAETNDTIETSEWFIAVIGPGTATLVKDSDDNTTTSTSIWLSGGSVGQIYLITNRITTAGARIKDQSARFKIV